MLDEFKSNHGADVREATGDVDPDRRAALRAIATYSGALGAGATLTVLSAQDAVATQLHSSDDSSDATIRRGGGDMQYSSFGSDRTLRDGNGATGEDFVPSRGGSVGGRISTRPDHNNTF